MHLATKRYHMIDFVVMRTYQRKYCLDMQVIRGAKCWTDHCLGRARLRVMLPRTAVTSKHPLSFAVHKFAKPELRDSYVRSLEQRSSGWSLHLEVQQKSIRTICNLVLPVLLKSLLEEEFTLNPEWFEENIDVLKPLIEEKNQTRSRYLQVGTRSCKQTYRRLQRKVQKAITDAKSKWILKVATEGEEAVKDGKIRWDCIRKL